MVELGPTAVELKAKLPLVSLYEAVIECVPTGKWTLSSAAVPELTGALPSAAPLSRNITFPSEGGDGEAETWAVRFTPWP